MPFVLASSAIGCITSVSPTAFGAIVSFGSVLAFISENATWMMLSHGLFNNPRVASDVSLPASAPIGILSLGLGTPTLVGVNPTIDPKLESFTGLSLVVQLPFQPMQKRVYMSECAPGELSPSQFTLSG